MSASQSSVNDLSFASDTKKLATCSKDGTWKMWNIDGSCAQSHYESCNFARSRLPSLLDELNNRHCTVRYAQKEDPKVLYSVKVGKPVEHIALSPDGSVVVISYEGQLHFYAAADGSPIDSVPRAHYGPSLSV
jgi:WD40 repeat protein